MCGIVGVIGEEDVGKILLEGLSRLEYRGYDSAGIAVRKKNDEIVTVKSKGKLKNLYEKTDGGNSLIGICGIGHTRWATHGEPSEVNAHPHMSDDRSVVGVHNGIIENYKEIREKLLKKGYSFYSGTDTEVAIKLIDYYYKRYKNPLKSISEAMVRIRGSYALAIMFSDINDRIYVVRKDSPIIIGINENSSYIASDVPAILPYTNKVYYMDNMEIGEIFSNNVCFYNTDCERITKEPKTVTWSAEEAQKNGYEHFMMKEIHEQPEAVENTVRAFIMDNKISFLESGFTDEDFKKISQIRIVACGSAYHVGLISQYVIEDLANIPVRVEYASEFRYRKNIFDKNELVIIISQSGETADSLFALREAKRNKIKTAAIVNVVGSSIARETDFAFYTLAGPEIAVATTKAYSAQLALCNMFAIELARVKGRINNEEYSRLIDELHALPDKIRNILTDKDKIQWFASKFAGMKDAFLIGRGIDYGICLEGSLKMKEISYIHSEAYAAGELKHGTISLIENGTLAIGVLTQDSLYEKTVNNLVEVKTRGAYIFALTTYGNYSAEEIADFTVFIPKTSKYFTPILAAVPLQLLGYYLSVAKGLDVDKPRNLAKSVTVE